MTKIRLALVGVFCLVGISALPAAEFHVATSGSDTNAGLPAAPLRTIQHAADLAQPGDTITVHAGVYRERIDPPRGGTSDEQRITYQAALGEKVTITGAEPVKGWRQVTNDTWQVTLSNSFFGAFNPYSDLIHGDWCRNPGGYHTGAVYLNGEWLTETTTNQNKVLPPAGSNALWFASVAATNTVIWAQFPGVNPNEQNVEINVRQTVFTPSKTGINYLTVCGFELRAAAAPWAPPTAGQIGIISAYWCKGWIIENNTIRYSPCCGVALGKYSDAWDNRSGGASGYVRTIQRALTNGWNQATVGSHLVRDNEISHCEQTGIVGSLGCAFSTVTGNSIHDIHTRTLYGGPEVAGIKFHGGIDVVIRHNHIYRCGGAGGIWLDWMGQGGQVLGNLLHDNSGGIFFEQQHGPILVANNLLLNKVAMAGSQGIAFVHNLILQFSSDLKDPRSTPFQRAHSTELVGLYPPSEGVSGDHRFDNNLFASRGDLLTMDKLALPSFAAGNVFTQGTKPAKFDTDALVQADFNPGLKLAEKADGWYLTFAADPAWRDAVKRQPVTTERLGKARVSGCAYENPDGSPLKIDTDYFGNPRAGKNPFPGPFEKAMTGTQEIKVWPRP